MSASTQWNASFGGLLGLRYEALPLLLELQGIPRAEWPTTLADLQVIEQEALRLSRQER